MAALHPMISIQSKGCRSLKTVVRKAQDSNELSIALRHRRANGRFPESDAPRCHTIRCRNNLYYGVVQRIHEEAIEHGRKLWLNGVELG